MWCSVTAQFYCCEFRMQSYFSWSCPGSYYLGVCINLGVLLSNFFFGSNKNKWNSENITSVVWQREIVQSENWQKFIGINWGAQGKTYVNSQNAVIFYYLMLSDNKACVGFMSPSKWMWFQHRKLHSTVGSTSSGMTQACSPHEYWEALADP